MVSLPLRVSPRDAPRRGASFFGWACSILIFAFLSGCNTAWASTGVSESKQDSQGNSIENAVKFPSSLDLRGSSREQARWIRRNFSGWRSVEINVLCRNGKEYDVHQIISSTGKERSVYFDVSNVKKERITNGKPTSETELMLRMVERSNIPAEEKAKLMKEIREEPDCGQ